MEIFFQWCFLLSFLVNSFKRLENSLCFLLICFCTVLNDQPFLLFLKFLGHQPFKFALLFLYGYLVLVCFLFLKNFSWTLSRATSSFSRAKLILFLFCIQQTLLLAPFILWEINYHDITHVEF